MNAKLAPGDLVMIRAIGRKFGDVPYDVPCILISIAPHKRWSFEYRECIAVACMRIHLFPLHENFEIVDVISSFESCV